MWLLLYFVTQQYGGHVEMGECCVVERLKRAGRITRRGAMQASARQQSALTQRVSARMTKGRSKTSVRHEVLPLL